MCGAKKYSMYSTACNEREPRDVVWRQDRFFTSRPRARAGTDPTRWRQQLPVVLPRVVQTDRARPEHVHTVGRLGDRRRARQTQRLGMVCDIPSVLRPVHVAAYVHHREVRLRHV